MGGDELTQEEYIHWNESKNGEWQILAYPQKKRSHWKNNRGVVKEFEWESVEDMGKLKKWKMLFCAEWKCQ